MKSKVVALLTALLASIAIAQPVTVPNTFQAGQPARASEVNSNFDALRQAINRGFGTFITQPVTGTSLEGTTVATASCPANTLVMSANCACDSAGGRNLGSLFVCDISGNGGVVGCYLEYGSYNPSLLSPRGRVTVQCLGAIANDGARIPAGLIPIANSDGTTKSIPAKSADTLSAELSAVEQRARADEAEFRRRTGR
jgi:hypothetical protein